MPTRPKTHAQRMREQRPTPRPRENRPTAARRGYNARWQRARIQFLRQHPLCITCQARGRTTAASVVDHVIPHRGDPALFWDEKNWQAMCEPCHNAKTGGGE